MGSRRFRAWFLALGLVLLFGGAVAVMMQVIPAPRKQADYLVIGATATFTAMLALFVVLITTWVKSADVFYKKRK